jgi:hypothetical protein
VTFKRGGVKKGGKVASVGRVAFLGTVVLWLAAIVAGLTTGEDRSTESNLVLFAIPTLLLGLVLNRWRALIIPFAVGLCLLALAIADPCAPGEEGFCVDGTGVFVVLGFFAPLSAALIGLGVLGRRGFGRLRQRRSLQGS